MKIIHEIQLGEGFMKKSGKSTRNQKATPSYFSHFFLMNDGPFPLPFLCLNSMCDAMSIVICFVQLMVKDNTLNSHFLIGNW